MRRWGRVDICDQVDDELAGKIDPDCKWLVNSQRQTFIVAPTGKYTIGAPDWEDDHEGDEVLQEVTVERPFALAATEVTVADFKHHRWENGLGPSTAPTSVDRW